jgi:hypothetical protein
MILKVFYLSFTVLEMITFLLELILKFEKKRIMEKVIQKVTEKGKDFKK